jgi:hypothetical protein
MNKYYCMITKHMTRVFTYITWTLLKFPNSAGIDPIRWFLLKFLHEQLWTSGNNAHRKDNMNSERLVFNIQFKKMLEITNSGRNWSREFIVGKIPVPKWRKK